MTVPHINPDILYSWAVWTLWEVIRTYQLLAGPLRHVKAIGGVRGAREVDDVAHRLLQALILGSAHFAGEIACMYMYIYIYVYTFIYLFVYTSIYIYMF